MLWQQALFDWDVAGAPLAYLYCQSIAADYVMLLLASDGAAVGGTMRVKALIYGSWEHFARWWYGVRTAHGALRLNDGLYDSQPVQDEDVEHERVAACREAWNVYLSPNRDVFDLLSGPFFRWICDFCRWFGDTLLAKEVPEQKTRQERYALLPNRAAHGVLLA